MELDGLSTAPSGAVLGHGKIASVLEELRYSQLISKDTAKLLDYLTEHEELLSSREKRMVKLVSDIKFLQFLQISMRHGNRYILHPWRHGGRQRKRMIFLFWSLS